MCRLSRVSLPSTLPGLRTLGEFWDELYYTDIVCASPERLSLGIWADRLRNVGHPGMYLRVLYPWGDDGFPWELIVDSIINLIASEPGIQVLPPPGQPSSDPRPCRR